MSNLLGYLNPLRWMSDRGGEVVSYLPLLRRIREESPPSLAVNPPPPSLEWQRRMLDTAGEVR